MLGEYTDGALGAVYADSGRIRRCLTRLTLDGTGLHPNGKACVDPVGGLAIPGSISPDGRWFAMATDEGELLFDLGTVFQDVGPTVRCPNSPNPSYVFWEDARHLVLLTGPGTWGRCGVDGTMTQAEYLPPDGSWTVVGRSG